ncbi:HNH endonuclease signature motif containing protein, partial [Knoellia sp. CPCC 206435]|uniref:HNH endonuclease signature motif containing protein n=1 Tax=Knoellia terrae TaxID=3404797 RepID=UPI003B4345AE
EVSLVMTDRTLLPAAFGGTAPADDCATIPGWGPVPGTEARAHIAALLAFGGDAHDVDGNAEGAAEKAGFVWLRRLCTDPTGRDLVALDSRRRRFHGGLRRFLELRDPTCRIPFCDAPGVESDHAHRTTDGGATDAVNGTRLCQRHNLVKELDGWHVRVESTGLDGTGAHGTRLTTPTGRTHDATAPPVLGHGWTPPLPDDDIHHDGEPPPSLADWWPDDDAYWAA